MKMREWVKNRDEILKDRPASLIALRQVAIDLINTAIESSQPDLTLKENVSLNQNTLMLGSISIDLSKIRNLYVVGFGKASYTMARSIEEILDDRITEGIVSTKFGYGGKLKKIKVIEAGHPIPSEEGLKAAKEIVTIAKKSKRNDLIILLVSGGGSALAPLPPDTISLSDKQKINNLLLSSGANIEEINAVRKHISLIKGGRFAEIAYPARVIGLIVSDVVGDRLDTISSGPSVPDNTTFEDAFGVLKKYNIIDKVPSTVISHIRKGIKGDIPETPKKGSKYFSRVNNIILINNMTALKSIERKARSLGFNTLILSSEIEGESIEVGKVMAGIAKETVKSGFPIPTPCVIISGGETTVTLDHSSGMGGPNQECAVGFATKMPSYLNVVFTAIDSDGTDGPTNYAGGIVDTESKKIWINKNIALDKLINDHNTSSILKSSNDIIITGSTGTNVNDIRIIIMSKTQKERRGKYG